MNRLRRCLLSGVNFGRRLTFEIDTHRGGSKVRGWGMTRELTLAMAAEAGIPANKLKVHPLSTPERKCIGAPERRCIGDERRKVV